jgi:hypothetical protein
MPGCSSPFMAGRSDPRRCGHGALLVVVAPLPDQTRMDDGRPLQ